MKKYLFFLPFVAALALVFSCTSPDPLSVYGPNPAVPVVSNGNIAGPRIVVRIDSSNITKREFVSSNPGVLQKVLYQGGSQDLITLGTNGKIASVDVNPASPNRSRISLVYNGTGRITNAVQQNYQNGTLTSTVESGVSYNTANRVSHVEKKHKNASNQYYQYTMVDITYNGANIIDVTQNSAAISGGAYQALNPANAVHYKFENYDANITPFSTLPQEYLIATSLLSSRKFGELSANNPRKKSVEIGNTGVITVLSQFSAFVYDSQAFLIGDSQNVMKVYYKPLQ